MTNVSRLRAAAIVVVAIAAALALAEGVFNYRDNGAFPHLNLYVEDPVLGVRLTPNRSQGFKLGTNPKTQIHVNATGYRGADWKPPTENEILVVGDSQVFGLGVDDDETFSARLEKLTKRVVINGGVPTYGPAEYTQVVDEILAKRPVTDVVYVINMVNDLFENERPNLERHAVLDGWAVRKETMPQVTDFPGRRFLFRNSHLVYAWRRATAKKTQSLRTPSEGSALDLIGRLPAVRAKQVASATATQAAKVGAEAEAELKKAELDATDIAAREYDPLPDDLTLSLRRRVTVSSEIIEASFAGAGDIVHEQFAEASSPVYLNASTIREAARIRRVLVRRWRRQQGHKKEVALRILAATKSRTESRPKWARPFDAYASDTTLLAHLKKVDAIARSHGARLNVVVLPIDVQVHVREWAKYGVNEPVDLKESEFFISEIVETAHRNGNRAASMLLPLRDAGAGAFLNGDIHLTPNGHRVVATEVARLLSMPAPVVAPPNWILDDNRTVVPTSDEWLQAREITIKGSSNARCGTWQIDEWFRMTCTPKTADNLLVDINVASPGSSDSDLLTYKSSEAVTAVFSLVNEDSVVVHVRWQKHSQRLRLHVVDDRVVGAFDAPISGDHALPSSAYVNDVMACTNRRIALNYKPRYGPKPKIDCTNVLSSVRPACSTYAPKEERQCSEAVLGGARPKCAPYSVLVGGTARCATTCGSAADCAAPQECRNVVDGGQRYCQ